MILGPHLREELARVVLLLAAALFGGWLLGQALLMLVVALLGYLLITLLQLAQLERQLSDRWMRAAHEQPPGLWRAIEEHLYQAWLRDVSPDGLFYTFNALFGYPFDLAIEPLVAFNLVQPAMNTLRSDTGGTIAGRGARVSATLPVATGRTP